MAGTTAQARQRAVPMAYEDVAAGVDCGAF
jgi:hypothetical protein